MKLFLQNYLLLILLSFLTLFSCVEKSTTDSNNSSTTSLSIDYEISENFYIALTNTVLELIQKGNFGSQSNFYVRPSLPNGLSLDVTNGGIKGMPTTVSLPAPYIVTATKDSKTYTSMIFLGVAPSEIWITNINSINPYQLTVYVVGDGSQQTGVSWSSSSEKLATVGNDGVVYLKTSPIGGDVVIAATKDGDTDRVTFNVPSTPIDYGTSDFYIALVSNQIDLVEKSKFSSTVFSITPALPNGLTLDVANGSVKGTPTAVMLPSEYTVRATEKGSSQTKIITLGVAPSEIWLTNTNSVKPYELTDYVVGDRNKQIGVSWISSDDTLATVNDGVVSFKNSSRGGTVVIAAIKDSYSNGLSFTVSKVEAVNNGKVIIENGNTNLIINSGVKAITSIQFENNPLTSVVIPDSVVYIGRAAFYNSGLIDVVISKKIKNIANSVFFGNRLTSVVIPNGVTNIGLAAFYNNQLTSVVIPNSVRTIGDGAFQNNQLTNVVIGSSVRTIGDGTFQNNRLTSVVIPDSVISIASSAFFNNQLTSVVIGDGVTNIANYAFYSNPNLVRVNLKQSLYDSLGSERSNIFGNQVTNYIKR